MKKIAGLFGLAVLVSATLAFVPSLSHSAQKKGTAAFSSQGKSTTAPVAKSKGGLAKPGGKDGTIKPGKDTAVARPKPKRPRPTGPGSYKCKWWCPPQGPRYCKWICPGDRLVP